MVRFYHLAIVMVLLAVSMVQLTAAEGTIRVITDRTESHLKPLFRHFTQTTGIEIEAVYVDKGLLARLEAQPTEADVIITKTAENLEAARQKGLLAGLQSAAVDTLDPAFVASDKTYVTTSYRARGIYVSKERVDAAAITSYADLAKPEYKGRVATRSGYHDYNVSLFCQIAEDQGLEAARTLITGLKANQARLPESNDRGQVKAISEGIADFSIGNSYYMALMLANSEQQAWGEATNFIFPDQSGSGTYVLRSAAALTKSDRNPQQAAELIDYLIGDFAQYYLSSALHVYPVKSGLPLSDYAKAFGSTQSEVVDGYFKAKFIPLPDIEKHREAIIEILNEVNYDQ